MEKMFKYFTVSLLSLALYSSALFGTTLYKYRIFCQTEDQFVYVWSETAPTQCPNNSSDTINPNSISIIEQIDSNEVSIKDEYVPTGHNFRAETKKISVAAGPDVTTIQYFSWPYNTTFLNLYFVTTGDHEGDIVYIDAPFDRIIGAVTASVVSSDTQIPVTQTVIDNVFVGYNLFLDDGTNLDDLGRVIAIDSVNNILTVETPTVHAFSPLTPTYVKITRRAVDFEIGCPHQYAIGMKTLTGSHVPANEPARVQYINKSSVSKDFILIYEYLY